MIIELFSKNESIDISIGHVKLFGDKGNYRLTVEGHEWMSYNTYLEPQPQKTELFSSYDLAYGDCIVSGLGFGIIANWLASKPEVKSIKVYEISKDIIELNRQYNKLHKKIEVINAPIADARGNKCNCLLLDHYESEDVAYIYRDVKYLSEIIDCDLVWFWRIEPSLMKWVFTARNLRSMELTHFMLLYKEWRLFLGIDKLPELSEDKLLEYLSKWPHSYTMRLTDDRKMISISGPQIL